MFTDTFDLQASGANGSAMQPKHVEAGFDGLGDEDEDPYDDQNDDDDDDDDGDALSSSPSIPDDVCPFLRLRRALLTLIFLGYRFRLHVCTSFFRGHCRGTGQCY
jgi:hypothetical protein